MLDTYLSLTTDDIEIRFAEADRPSALLAGEALGERVPELLKVFEIDSGFPPIQVVLVPDRDEFDRLVRDLLKVEIEVPSHPARIAQPQRTDMVVLSPAAYAEHSIYEYVPDEFRRLLVHEVVHMIEEFLSPDIEASPRWWGEGLAVFFSGQSTCEEGFRKPALDGIAKGAIPTIEEIESEAKHAYDWGWTLVAFIECHYGTSMIVRMVKECADGDVLSFLDESHESIESRWRAWLLEGGLEEQSSPSEGADA